MTRTTRDPTYRHKPRAMMALQSQWRDHHEPCRRCSPKTMKMKKTMIHLTAMHCDATSCADHVEMDTILILVEDHSFYSSTFSTITSSTRLAVQ